MNTGETRHMYRLDHWLEHQFKHWSYPVSIVTDLRQVPKHGRRNRRASSSVTGVFRRVFQGVRYWSFLKFVRVIQSREHWQNTILVPSQTPARTLTRTALKDKSSLKFLRVPKNQNVLTESPACQHWIHGPSAAADSRLVTRAAFDYAWQYWPGVDTVLILILDTGAG